ncbi:MAG: lactonase family protein [Tepidisphaeraceae bacterium]
MRFYLGSYSNPTSRGIYQCEVDGDTGKLSQPRLLTETTNPTFLALDPAATHLYALVETKAYADLNQNGVAAFAVDPKTMALKALNQQPSGGNGVCFVATDRTGTLVLVANYNSADIASIPVEPDGSLRAPASVLHQTGTGPNKSRQSEPHAHSIIADPTNRFALSADLGADLIYVYTMNLEAGTLTPTQPYRCPPGCGPRHLAFDHSGKILYVINELDATVLVLNWDATRGTLSHRQTIFSLPPGTSIENNTASEIAVHPKLPYVYCANRGHDSIAVFSQNPDGTLTLITNVSTHGHGPRHFAIDPTGRTLVVANQHASNVVSYTIDGLTGIPAFADTFEWHKSMCIRFMPQ